MDVVFAASEAVGFVKTGGLADAVTALANHLAQFGHSVTLFLPLYRAIKTQHPSLRKITSFPVPIRSQQLPVDLFESTEPRAPRLLFIDQPTLFDRVGIYGDAVDFPDNDLRFTLYAKAVLEAIHHLELPVDCLHAHDWQAGLLPPLARTLPSHQSRLAHAGIVFTIHNLAFQGRFPKDSFPITGLDKSLFDIDGIEFWGDWSMLKAGIVFADQITTVSPTYAREIRQPENGLGFDGLIRQRAARLVGIVNGIDTDAWNPATDPALHTRYTRHDWRDGKAQNKRALQQETGLPLDPNIPLMGMVTRLTPQKGIDLLGDIAKNLLNMPIQLVILGTGDAGLEEMVRQFATWYPDRVFAKIGFDEPLAHRIYAGSDWFLMPSRFEPCGLSQLYALRYGAVPIVHRVGGLVDTVDDATPTSFERGTATGFHFRELTAAGIMGAIARAREAFDAPAVWHRLVDAGMKQDWSWNASARAYEQVYRQAIDRRRSTEP